MRLLLAGLLRLPLLSILLAGCSLPAASAGPVQGPDQVALTGEERLQVVFLVINEYLAGHRRFRGDDKGATWHLDWGAQPPPEELLSKLESRGFRFLELPKDGQVEDGQYHLLTDWELDGDVLHLTLKSRIGMLESSGYRALLREGEWWLRWDSWRQTFDRCEF